MTLTTRPSTPLQHDPDLVRPLVTGPPEPEAPYPIYLDGWVERGFGRGSKDLGCPTGTSYTQQYAAGTLGAAARGGDWHDARAQAAVGRALAMPESPVSAAAIRAPEASS